MSLTNVELYEALKGSVGEDAAKLIAEVVPAAKELATKVDISGLQTQIADLRTEIHRSNTTTVRWMLGFFVPIWVGTWATFVAILLKH